MTFGGNSFNDFPENQLTTFLCKPTWGNATVSPFPLVLISFGGTAFPQNIWRTASPTFKKLHFPRLHHWSQAQPRCSYPPAEHWMFAIDFNYWSASNSLDSKSNSYLFVNLCKCILPTFNCLLPLAIYFDFCLSKSCRTSSLQKVLLAIFKEFLGDI